jgi:hypothetical protein
MLKSTHCARHAGNEPNHRVELVERTAFCSTSRTPWNGRKSVAAMRALRDHAKNHRDDAKLIAADPAFKDLDPKKQADITAIGEEMDLLLAEMDEETDPDKKWTKADGTSKLDATAGMRVDDAAVEKFKARASGKMRGQVAPKPNPPGQIK